MMKDDEAIATVITALSASISLWVGIRALPLL